MGKKRIDHLYSYKCCLKRLNWEIVKKRQKTNVFCFSSFGKDNNEGTECINFVQQKPEEKDK